eukprot:403334456
MKNSLIIALAIASTISLVLSQETIRTDLHKEMESSLNFGLTNQPFKIQKQMEINDPSNSIRQENYINERLYSTQEDGDYLKIKNLRKSTLRQLQRRSAQRKEAKEKANIGIGLGIGLGLPSIYILPCLICFWCKMCYTYEYREGRAVLRCKKCCKEPVCKYQRPLSQLKDSLFQKAKRDGIVGAPDHDIMNFYKMQQQASALNQINQLAAQMNMLTAQMNMGMGLQNYGMQPSGGFNFYQPTPALMNMQYSNNVMLPTQQNYLMTDDSLTKPNQVTDRTLGIPIQNQSMMQSNYGYDPNTSISPLNQQKPQVL